MTQLTLNIIDCSDHDGYKQDYYAHTLPVRIDGGTICDPVYRDLEYRWNPENNTLTDWTDRQHELDQISVERLEAHLGVAS